MPTKSSKSKNNSEMSARKERNEKELDKLHTAEVKLKARSPKPGSKNDLLIDAIKKKRKALEAQNKLIDKYMASNSKRKRSSLKQQIEDDDLPPFPYTKAGSVCVKCMEKKAKLTKVDFLDGNDSKTVNGEGKQFVNFPLNLSRTGPRTSLATSSKIKKWVDSKFAKNLDRVGTSVRVKAEVSPALPGIPVYFRLIGDSNNARYSDSKTDPAKRELTRNLNFGDDTSKPSDPWRVIEFTNKKGIAIARLKVSQAGANVYQVEAKTLDGTKQKGAGKIKTDRLVYYKEFKMESPKVKEATSLGKFKAAFAKGHITMESLGKTTMTHLPNIDTDTSDFLRELRDAFETSDAVNKMPFAIAIAYTDHLAVKRANKMLSSATVDVGPGKPAVTIDVRGDGLTNPAVKTRYLWNNLVPGEGWLRNATFHPSGGGATTDLKSKCKAVPGGNPDACCQVEVDVSALPAGRGVIKITVDWVDRMRGGLALGDNNAALVCTRAWWKDASNDSQVQVMIHEVGHKVQMVADGRGIRPDKVKTHYDSSKGHVGDHCYKGNADGQARYDAPTDAANAKCVMYGSTNANLEFCANCEPAVRKVDLSGGWSSI